MYKILFYTSFPVYRFLRLLMLSVILFFSSTNSSRFDFSFATISSGADDMNLSFESLPSTRERSASILDNSLLSLSSSLSTSISPLRGR